MGHADHANVRVAHGPGRGLVIRIRAMQGIPRTPVMVVAHGIVVFFEGGAIFALTSFIRKE